MRPRTTSDILESSADLSAIAVEHCPCAALQKIEERYECDSGGGIRVTIANQTAGYKRSYQLGRWSAQTKSVKPVSKSKRAKA
jgi:hypothetical protein